MDNNVYDSAGGAHLYNGSNVQFVKDRFGKANSAIRFTDGYYQVPPGVYFKGDFTVSVWIKAIGIVNTGGTIIDFGNGVSSDNIRFITSYQNEYKPVFYVNINNYESNVEPSLTLVLGQWTHLVFTLSGSNGALYMNGLLISQSSDLFTPRNINRTLNYIGKDNWNSYLDGNGNLWADLDDLRFYNRAMSQAEINYLFLQQASTQASNLNR